jgi:hypothetical protein
MAFLLIVQSPVAAWHVWRTRRFGAVTGFGLGAMFTFLLFLPGLPGMLALPHDTGSSLGALLGKIKSVGEAAASGGALIPALIAGLAAFLIAGLGVMRCWRASPHVVVFLFGPSLLGVSVLLALGHHVYPRFFFLALGFALLVTFEALLGLGRLGKPLLGLAVAAMVALVPRAYGPKQDFTKAKEFVEANLKPHDAVAITQVTSMVYQNHYASKWTRVASYAELRKLCKTSPRTWILYTIPEFLETEQPEMYLAIKTKFRKVARFPGTLTHGDIIVCIYEKGGGEL